MHYNLVHVVLVSKPGYTSEAVDPEHARTSPHQNLSLVWLYSFSVTVGGRITASSMMFLSPWFVVGRLCSPRVPPWEPRTRSASSGKAAETRCVVGGDSFPYCKTCCPNKTPCFIRISPGMSKLNTLGGPRALS